LVVKTFDTEMTIRTLIDAFEADEYDNRREHMPLPHRATQAGGDGQQAGWRELGIGLLGVTTVGCGYRSSGV